MVRKELGFPQAECLAADERYSLDKVTHPLRGQKLRSGTLPHADSWRSGSGRVAGRRERSV
jgi:hypothetical protein